MILRHRHHVAPVLAVLAALVASVVGAAPAAAQESPTAADVVDAAYEGLLGRAPDPGGRAFWIGEADGGVPLGRVVEAIGDADEQRRLVVREAYRDVLDREPDTAGWAFWSEGIIDRLTVASLRAQLYASPEFFLRAGGTNEGFLDALYRSVFDRDPEADGRAYWLAQLDLGLTRLAIAELFVASPEAILQPELSIVSTTPPIGPPVGSLDIVTITLDRAVVAEASAVIVSVDGRRVAGTTSAVIGDDRSLRFAASSRPSWVQLGQSAPAAITVFAYDGDVVERTDAGLTFRPTAGNVAAGDDLIVAFYGHPRAPVLGVAGEGTPQEALAALLAQAAPYAASGKTIVPAFEMIATLVTGAPGPDNLHRSRASEPELRTYLDTIRTVGGRMILDIQPGRADVLDEAMAHEALLLEPEVGLALDPEWVVGPTQTPQGRIGTLDAADINRVSAYLSRLAVDNDLPPRILIIHRFRPDMVTNTDAIVSRPGVRIIFHADGEGGPGAKIADYDTLMPPRFERGIKIFYDEDVNRMTPEEVLARLDPTPTFVSYQ